MGMDVVSSWGDENVLKLEWWCLHNSVNPLKTSELYTFKG